MRATRLYTALKQLRAAVREVDSALEEMTSERDPLAVHIFVSRRRYRNMSDTKSNKRHDMEARSSWQEAQSKYGLRLSLDEWERLLDAPLKR